LEAAHPGALREVGQAVAEATDRIKAEAAAWSPDVTAARVYIEALQRRGLLDDKKIAAIAKGARLEEITTALAVKCELPLEFVERAMKEEHAEMVLIIAKAIALSWPTVKAIVCARARTTAISGREIAQCAASYERLKITTAQEIVRFHRLRDRTETRPPS
jgi:Uncharacterised protein conserved in bacteria (DUF2336)